MEPHDLGPQSFAKYPSEGRAFATRNIELFRQLPLSLLPLILRQVVRYDWAFPAERRQLEMQCEVLGQMQPQERADLLRPLTMLSLPAELRRLDWVNHSQQFTEKLTAYLWSEHRIDDYHLAVEAFQRHIHAASRQSAPAISRWTIVVVGSSLGPPQGSSFQKLLPYGTLFNSIHPDGGWPTLLQHARLRAQKQPVDYGHWYIEGGHPDPEAQKAAGLTVTSYANVASAATTEMKLLREYLDRASSHGQAGPEAATSFLANLDPDTLYVNGKDPHDSHVRHFEADLLTQGAGCQIFSTTYVQWAARECLHRAEPSTLLVRFGPRQRMAPMDQLLSRDPFKQSTDLEGSRVDAEMGAFYTWINQSRLPGADQARFLAWFEDHGIALAAAPTLPRGKTSTSALTMQQLIDLMT